MKKGGLILVFGVMVATVAFFGCYYLGTAGSRDLMKNPQPELAWLKREFRLSDSEFARITQLHEAYLPQCAERCRLIEEQSRKLRQLLAVSSTVTPQIEEVLQERARIRAQCEAEMLKHFRQVSLLMPPEQGRLYLEWIEGQTVLRAQAMEARHKPETNRPSMAMPHQ